MGTYLFKWEHPANEVFVTGTFDNWAGTQKLEKKGDIFEKVVTLPKADEKIYYKFVVDGNWVTNHTSPQEADEHNNANNVLTPAEIEKLPPVEGAAVAAISSVAPAATTAKLAEKVPVVTPDVGKSPGGFPETPGEQTFSVNPIPATAGGGNPIKLAPGEPVPHPSTLTDNTIQSTVKLDKESYENPTSADIAGASALPPLSKNMIPESSLPIKELPATIQSSGPDTTTAALAGQVPLENQKVPEVVKDSQNDAKTSAEASGVPASVDKKATVEAELTSKVPEAPATAESETKLGTAGDYAAGAVAGLAGAAAAAAAYIEGKTHIAEKAAPYTAAAQEKSAPYIKQAEEAAAPYTKKIQEQTAPFAAAVQEKYAAAHPESKPAEDVPEAVKSSLRKAHKDPEAAASEEAVLEKAAVESELLKEVKKEESTGESAPKPAGAAATEEADKAKGTVKETAEKAKDKAEGAAASAKKAAKGESSSGAITEEPTTSKKSKRLSLFGKIKSKLHLDKDKEPK